MFLLLLLFHIPYSIISNIYEYLSIYRLYIINIDINRYIKVSMSFGNQIIGSTRRKPAAQIDGYKFG
jgi:hypothetical protein